MENQENQENKRSYLSYLPAMYDSGREDDFLQKYLKIFEKILTGLNDGVKVDGKELKGVSETLDNISDYFLPYTEDSAEKTAPIEFVNWLASWVGLVMKEDWSESKKRKVLARIIPLYRIKGTRRGLEEFLNVYVEGGVKVYDNVGLFQVGVNSRIGTSTAIDMTNSFRVEITLSDAEQQLNAIARKKKLIETIVLREKPVHTNHELVWLNVSSLQIEVRSTVQVNTLLWNYQEKVS